MSTYAPAPPVQAHHRPHINPWLVAVVVLAAALIGLAAFEIVDRTTGGGGATQNAATLATQKATTLIDKYNAAINAHDWEAAAAFFTRDAVYYDGSNHLVGRNNLLNAMYGVPADYRAKRIAPVIVARDAAGHEFVTTFANEEPVISGPVPQIYQLKDGKILREWEFALGTAPFADAVTR